MMANTIATDGGSSAPSRSAQRERDSGLPEYAKAAARRPINHRVSTTAQVITAAIAARLANTLSRAAASATSQFSSMLRLMTSNRYRTRCTSAATPSVTAVTKNTVRTRPADGASRSTRPDSALPGSAGSRRPHRGIAV